MHEKSPLVCVCVCFCFCFFLLLSLSSLAEIIEGASLSWGGGSDSLSATRLMLFTRRSLLLGRILFSLFVFFGGILGLFIAGGFYQKQTFLDGWDFPRSKRAYEPIIALHRLSFVLTIPTRRPVKYGASYRLRVHSTEGQTQKNKTSGDTRECKTAGRA